MDSAMGFNKRDSVSAGKDADGLSMRVPQGVDLEVFSNDGNLSFPVVRSAKKVAECKSRIQQLQRELEHENRRLESAKEEVGEYLLILEDKACVPGAHMPAFINAIGLDLRFAEACMKLVLRQHGVKDNG